MVVLLACAPQSARIVITAPPQLQVHAIPLAAPTLCVVYRGVFPVFFAVPSCVILPKRATLGHCAHPYCSSRRKSGPRVLHLRVPSAEVGVRQPLVLFVYFAILQAHNLAQARVDTNVE